MLEFIYGGPNAGHRRWHAQLRRFVGKRGVTQYPRERPTSGHSKAYVKRSVRKRVRMEGARK